MSFQSFKLNWHTRIGAEFGFDQTDKEIVTIRPNDDAEWRLEISPYNARVLARRLRKAADLLEPPRPRKRK